MAMPFRAMFPGLPLSAALLMISGCRGSEGRHVGELDTGSRSTSIEATPAALREHPRGVAVVELFTSEGCSSCPPADALLTRLSDETRADGAEVIPLSMHVDYWNRLGWRDPFSDRTYSDRQGAYARRLGVKSVYTPQIVVNGTTELVGSNESGVREAVDRAIAVTPAATVTLTTSSGSSTGAVTVAYDVAGAPAGSSLVLAVTERDLTVRVPSGENAGRTLRHDNVVRSLRSVPLDSSARGTVTVPLTGVSRRDRAGLVAFVQNRETLRITGAATVPVGE